MTALNLVRMFLSVQAFPKMFGKHELRLVFQRLWELHTQKKLFREFRGRTGKNLVFIVWRVVVRTGFRRTLFFDAFLSWSLERPHRHYSTNSDCAEALAIVSVPHKHGAYRNIEVTTMRTLFQRVAPQGLII